MKRKQFIIILAFGHGNVAAAFRLGHWFRHGGCVWFEYVVIEPNSTLKRLLRMETYIS